MDDLMFVEYKDYCYRCEHKDVPETQDPCDECMDEPALLNSFVPLHYEPNEEEKKRLAKEAENNKKNGGRK